MHLRLKLYFALQWHEQQRKRKARRTRNARPAATPPKTGEVWKPMEGRGFGVAVKFCITDEALKLEVEVVVIAVIRAVGVVETDANGVLVCLFLSTESCLLENFSNWLE